MTFYDGLCDTEHQLDVFTSVINKWMEAMSPGKGLLDQCSA